MAASKTVLAWLGWLGVVAGVVVFLGGLMGRAFEAEYGGTVEGEMIVPNVTIAIGVLLIVVGVVSLVQRSKTDS